MMAPDRPSHLGSEVAAFAARIAPAGAVNGLAQVVLRCASPGVPDLYQGTEFWDFSLVDPDNRRPVDWAARREALDADLPPAELLGVWRDGRVKQAVLFRALQLRAAKPELFAEGGYLPVSVEGAPGRERAGLRPRPSGRGGARGGHAAFGWHSRRVRSTQGAAGGLARNRTRSAAC